MQRNAPAECLSPNVPHKVSSESVVGSESGSVNKQNHKIINQSRSDSDSLQSATEQGKSKQSRHQPPKACPSPLCLHVFKHEGKSPVGGIQTRAIRPILYALAEISFLQLRSQYLLNRLPPLLSTHALVCSCACTITFRFCYLHIKAWLKVSKGSSSNQSSNFKLQNLNFKLQTLKS